MVTEKEIKEAYAFLENSLRDYYTLNSAKERREWIERRVRTYADNNLSGDLYLDLNEDSASGLFRHGFFLSDLERSVSILRKMINKKDIE